MPGMEHQELSVHNENIIECECAGNGRSNSTSTHLYEQNMKIQVFCDVRPCRLLGSHISKERGVTGHHSVTQSAVPNMQTPRFFNFDNHLPVHAS
jgi:hypothetical protein